MLPDTALSVCLVVVEANAVLAVVGVEVDGKASGMSMSLSGEAPYVGSSGIVLG